MLLQCNRVHRQASMKCSLGKKSDGSSPFFGFCTSTDRGIVADPCIKAPILSQTYGPTRRSYSFLFHKPILQLRDTSPCCGSSSNKARAMFHFSPHPNCLTFGLTIDIDHACGNNCRQGAFFTRSDRSTVGILIPKVLGAKELNFETTDIPSIDGHF